jgi:hypothetical protein
MVRTVGADRHTVSTLESLNRVSVLMEDPRLQHVASLSVAAFMAEAGGDNYNRFAVRLAWAFP